MDTQIRNQRIQQLGFAIIAIDLIANLLNPSGYTLGILIGLILLGLFLLAISAWLEAKARKDPQEVQIRVERLISKYIGELVEELYPRLKDMLDKVTDTERPELYNLIKDFIIETDEAKSLLESYLSDYPNDLKRVLKTLITIDMLSATQLHWKHFNCSLWQLTENNKKWKIVASSSEIPSYMFRKEYDENSWIGSQYIRDARENQNEVFVCYSCIGKSIEQNCVDLVIDIGDHYDLIRGSKSIFFLDIPNSQIGSWSVVVKSNIDVESIEQKYGVFDDDAPSQFQIGLTHIVERAKDWRDLNIRVTVSN